MSLKTYQAKRNFSSTSEPPAKKRVRGSGRATFVVQKHAARRLHFDFRLEMEGVLKSWAVPKGFPSKRGERRLAMEVEDHPVEYGTFEGTIPEGNYGAGVVQVWDRGTYQVEDGTPIANWHAGKLSVLLHGKKLRGRWTLVRARSADAPNAWLLLKTGESVKEVPSIDEKKSVLSGKTMEQLARSRRTWKSDRPPASSTRPTGSFREHVRKLAARRAVRS
jgi:bifunctional non-homologous end joining protein LigD